MSDSHPAGGDSDHGREDDPLEEQSVLGTLSDAARTVFDDPDADASAEEDLPDDRTGVEVPQDGDPGR